MQARPVEMITREKVNVVVESEWTAPSYTLTALLVHCVGCTVHHASRREALTQSGPFRNLSQTAFLTMIRSCSRISTADMFTWRFVFLALFHLNHFWTMATPNNVPKWQELAISNFYWKQENKRWDNPIWYEKCWKVQIKIKDWKEVSTKHKCSQIENKLSMNINDRHNVK